MDTFQHLEAFWRVYTHNRLGDFLFIAQQWAHPDDDTYSANTGICCHHFFRQGYACRNIRIIASVRFENFAASKFSPFLHSPHLFCRACPSHQKNRHCESSPEQSVLIGPKFRFRKFKFQNPRGNAVDVFFAPLTAEWDPWKLKRAHEVFFHAIDEANISIYQRNLFQQHLMHWSEKFSLIFKHTVTEPSFSPNLDWTYCTAVSCDIHFVL